jgi:hypothetical protein
MLKREFENMPPRPKYLLWENSIVDKREPSADDTNSSLAERQTSNDVLSSTSASTLATLGCQTGANAASDNGGVWLGGGGAYTNTYTNNAGEDLILVIWGPDASWVNANQPLVTVDLPAGGTQLVSFASGSIGAWSAIYSDTVMSNGQISNTWGEYTFSPEGVVDVSREVNMSGHGMSIVGPQCTTDMNTCVFVCSSGNVCLTNYELLNCAPGSQAGAQYGTYGGFPSGGCGGLGDSAAVTTYLW